MIADEIRALLRNQPVFSALSDDELTELAAAGVASSLPMGKTVFAEGDRAEAAWLVFGGRVRILRTEGNHQITLATEGRGTFIGERALLEGGAHTTTVRAMDDCVLIRFDHAAVHSFFAARPALQAFFDQLAASRALRGFLRTSWLLRELPPHVIGELVGQFGTRSLTRDEVLFCEGDPGDAIFILRSGELAVIRERDGQKQVLARIIPGEFVGERALVLEQPRAATVVATVESECLTLDKAQFDRLIATEPQLMEKLLKQVRGYEAVDQSVIETISASQSPSFRLEPDYAATTQAQLEEDPVPEPATATWPWRRPTKRFVWLQQADETDCGAAALATVARHYGQRLSVAKLREVANVGREGASMYSLARAAEAIGFSTRAVRVDFTQLPRLQLPAVAHWEGYHYVVVCDVTPDQVVISDPAIGIRKLSHDEFRQGWGGILLLLYPTPKLRDQEQEQTTFRRFLPLISPHALLLAEVMAASIAINLFGLAMPVFTQTVIDKVFVHQDARLLNVMLVGMMVVGLFSTLTVMLRQYLLIHVSMKISLRMSSDLFRQTMRLPMRFFHTRRVGDIITRFGDNEKVRELLTGSTIRTILDLAMVIVYATAMVIYDAKLAAVALVFIPLSAAAAAVFSPVMKRNNNLLFDRHANVQSKLIEAVNKVAAVKAATAELPVRWRFEDSLVKQAEQEFKSVKLDMGMMGTSSAIQVTFSTAILWYGAGQVMAGELTVGQLMAFQMLAGMVMTPVLGLINAWHHLQDALLSLGRLNAIYDATPEDESTAVIALPRLKGGIRFENVSFRYSSDMENVLSNVSFDVHPGETIAVVGRSGSGKSTLVALLQRLYKPTEGRVLFDDIDTAFVPVHQLRAHLGVVSQETALFTGTIRDNIALHDPEASMASVIAAAKLANAHDFIVSFPMGYETVVGEVGISLSGGQKQRVAIARALIRDPKVIIFDEATSALDSESERAIQSNMSAIMENRTAIIIAHRLSTIRNADRILVLDRGILVEQGDHRQLMERRNLYYYLNEQQLGS